MFPCSITLPETNIAPKNGWLEYDPFLLGFGLFSGAFAVSFREVSPKKKDANNSSWFHQAGFQKVHQKGLFCFKWVFPKIGVPQNGWFIRENPIKMDDLGVFPYFWKHPNLGPICRRKTGQNPSINTRAKHVPNLEDHSS